VPRSCGNRHCPTCQWHKTQEWLAKQVDRRLPCPYFLITFTVPPELQRVIRSHQRAGYEALFQSALDALRKLAADPKYLGAARLGLLAVLHTWGRTMNFHPHLHVLVPAGGLSKDSQQWHASPDHFFLPVKPLSVIYRAKMRDALAAAGLADKVPAQVWDRPWIVHCKAVGDGENCLQYLARYVSRVAISNRRIVSCDDGQVAFQYRKSGSRRWRTMTLNALEFIRRFLQHVLPSGFMKVRHCGFLSPNARESHDEIQQRIEEYYSALVEQLPAEEREPTEVTCPDCGRPMRLLGMLPAPMVLAYDDSG
jgi:hypothetical protein